MSDREQDRVGHGAVEVVAGFVGKIAVVILPFAILTGSLLWFLGAAGVLLAIALVDEWWLQ